MSTPGFIAQDENSLTEVRYYTALDPYYFAVDNRPLQDLASNITTISQGGGDSARRAVLLTQLALSSVFQELFSTSNANGLMSGLTVSYPGANTIQVNPGALYQTTVLNASIGTPVVKQALLLAAQTFNIVQPSVAGQSIAYVIEGQYQDLSSANMSSSPLPFLDPNNQFLPCLLLNGQLALQLKAGTSAPTGSQTEPPVDAGWVPLYTIIATYGQTNPVIYANANAPAMRGLHQAVNAVALPSADATSTPIAGISALTFPKGSTTGVALPISLRNTQPSFSQSFPNPYVPIKLKLVYSSDQTGGNFAMQLNYMAAGAGDSTAGSLIPTAIEAVPMNVSANSIASYNTATAVIPATAFSGLTNGVWSVTKQKLFVTLERVPGNAADTAAGNLFLHDVIAYQ